MKLDWQQLSPRERESALKHYILHDKANCKVSAQKVCEEMARTHSLFCDQSLDGPQVFQFVAGKGQRNGMATSNDLNEGIYKAALRAQGIELSDPRETPLPQQMRSAVRNAPRTGSRGPV